ncbi:MAG: outer membrane beta-barrel protein [Flavobacteriales bacterium]|nr:outer membrane beta-barrel protein [Flavobacteriales bacterium]
MWKIIIILTFLIPLIGFSQKISLGPEIGVNIIPIEHSQIGQEYHLGYHFGGHLKYHFSNKFKLSTGIFLTQKKKGYSSKTTGSVFTLFNDFLNDFGGLGGGLGLPVGLDSLGLDSTLNIPGLNTDFTETTRGITSELFIEIPILANYKYKNVNFYLGPYVGILISANRKEEVITDIPILDVIDLDALLGGGGNGLGGLASSFLPSSGTKTSSSSGTTSLRKLYMGFNAGIGYEMNNLHFNLMYSHGLLDYRNSNDGLNTETLKLVRLSMVYFFDLGKKEKESSARFK